MRTSFSRIVIASAFGALLASGLFDGPLSLVSADQFSMPAGFTDVNRTTKGDRLRVAPDANTIVIRTTPAIRGKASASETSDPRFVPTSLEDCEPVASPYADPKLGKFAAKCFV